MHSTRTDLTMLSRRTLPLLAGAAVLGASPAAAQVTAPAQVPAEYFQTPPIIRKTLPAPRRLADPAAMGTAFPEHRLGPLDPARVELARLEEVLDSERPTRTGFVRATTGAGLSLDDAASVVLDDGSVLFSLSIRAPEAKATRLHFVDTALGESVMTVFTAIGERTWSRGPYRGSGPRGDGDFWTGSLPGEVAHVEIVAPAGTVPTIRIAEIVHYDRDPAPPADGGTNRGGVFGCHLDAACEPLPDASRAATGQMNYVSGSEAYVCSGTLLGDLDPETAVPYFITAAHCVSAQSEVNTLEVVWNWERASCGGALPDYFALPRNEGGALLVTYSENDMSFIRLDGGVLTNGMAGWTTETSLDDAHGFHHPSGDFKRAVYLDSVGVCPGCLCLDGDDFDYYNMTDGLVEGGSSGSGVFNDNSQFAGQLYGRCAEFSDPADMNCTNIDTYWAVYGEFESTYEDTDVSYWLSLGGSIHVDQDGPICENGTVLCPFNTIAEGHDFAWDGATLVIHTGFYQESVTLSKNLEIAPLGGTVIIAGQ